MPWLVALCSPVHGVLCRISSDLRRMNRENSAMINMVLVQTVHIQSAGATKPNAKTRGTGIVLKCGV